MCCLLHCSCLSLLVSGKCSEPRQALGVVRRARYVSYNHQPDRGLRDAGFHIHFESVAVLCVYILVESGADCSTNI